MLNDMEACDYVGLLGEGGDLGIADVLGSADLGRAFFEEIQTHYRCSIPKFCCEGTRQCAIAAAEIQPEVGRREDL